MLHTTICFGLPGDETIGIHFKHANIILPSSPIAHEILSQCFEILFSLYFLLVLFKFFLVCVVSIWVMARANFTHDVRSIGWVGDKLNGHHCWCI